MTYICFVRVLLMIYISRLLDPYAYKYQLQCAYRINFVACTIGSAYAGFCISWKGIVCICLLISVCMYLRCCLKSICVTMRMCSPVVQVAFLQP